MVYAVLLLLLVPAAVDACANPGAASTFEAVATPAADTHAAQRIACFECAASWLNSLAPYSPEQLASVNIRAIVLDEPLVFFNATTFVGTVWLENVGDPSEILPALHSVAVFRYGALGRTSSDPGLVVPALETANTVCVSGATPYILMPRLRQVGSLSAAASTWLACSLSSLSSVSQDSSVWWGASAAVSIPAHAANRVACNDTVNRAFEIALAVGEAEAPVSTILVAQPLPRVEQVALPGALAPGAVVARFVPLAAPAQLVNASGAPVGDFLLAQTGAVPLPPVYVVGATPAHDGAPLLLETDLTVVTRFRVGHVRYTPLLDAAASAAASVVVVPTQAAAVRVPFRLVSVDGGGIAPMPARLAPGAGAAAAAWTITSVDVGAVVQTVEVDVGVLDTVGNHTASIVIDGIVLPFVFSVTASVPAVAATAIRVPGSRSVLDATDVAVEADLFDAFGNAVAGVLPDRLSCFVVQADGTEHDVDVPLNATATSGNTVRYRWDALAAAFGAGTYDWTVWIAPGSARAPRVTLSPACGPGSFSEYGGPCAPCPADTWAADERRTDELCTPCPPRTTTRGVRGAANASLCVCVEGTARAGDECAVCPPTVFCDGGAAAPRARDGWVISGGQAVRCPTPGACRANNTCAPGYTGSLCLTCAPGFSRSPAGGCAPCSPAAGGVFAAVFVAVLVGMVAFVAAVAWFGLRGDSGGARAREWRALVSLVVFFQVSWVVSVGAFTWTRSSGSMLSWLGVFTFDSRVLGIECALGGFKGRYFVVMLVPVLFLGVVLACAAVVYLAPECFSFTPPELVARALSTGVSVLYVALTRHAFSYFDCARFPDGRFYLEDEPSIECGSPRWTAGAPVAALLVVVYAIGVLAAMTGTLSVFSGRLDDKGIMRRYGAFYTHLRKGAHYTEVFQLLRRALIVGSVTFFAAGRPEQTVVLFGIHIAALCAELRFTPYRIVAHNVQAATLTAITLTIIFLGLLVRGSAQHVSDAGITALLAALLLASVAVTAFTLVREMYPEAQQQAYGEAVPLHEDGVSMCLPSSSDPDV